VTKKEAIYACTKNGGWLASLDEEGALKAIMDLDDMHGLFWVSGKNTRPV